MYRRAFHSPQRFLSDGEAFVGIASRRRPNRWPDIGEALSQGFSNERDPPSNDDAAPSSRYNLRGKSDRDEVPAQEHLSSGRGRGRGRGAFSYFLSVNERTVEGYSKAVPELSMKDRSHLPEERGQFDDAPSGNPDVTRWTRISREQADDIESSTFVQDWAHDWYNQCKETAVEGFEDALADDSDSDDLDELEYDKKRTWWVRCPEELEQYKKLEKSFEIEKREQLVALQKRFHAVKAKAKANQKDPQEVELPEVVVTNTISYTAPVGKSSLQRPRPRPRHLEEILESNKLPKGLHVTPKDPEHQQIVNFWTALSQNNTYNEKMKKRMLHGMAKYIWKTRGDTTLERIVTLRDTTKTPQKAKKKGPTRVL